VLLFYNTTTFPVDSQYTTYYFLYARKNELEGEDRNERNEGRRKGGIRKERKERRRERKMTSA
jgi:hypothetical protein